jgi:hypothetical protein
MKCHVRVRSDLVQAIHQDLSRPHAFAAERVGFVVGRAARCGDGDTLITCFAYDPVADEDYANDPTVGAMMGPAAIRKALQRALNKGDGDLSLLHVHRHDHFGFPRFSRVDVRETAKFVPDFFHVAPLMPHGAIVLSYDKAFGMWWASEDAQPKVMDRISSIGAPLRIWSQHP